MEPRKVHVHGLKAYCREGGKQRRLLNAGHTEGPRTNGLQSRRRGPNGAGWKLEQGCLFPLSQGGTFSHGSQSRV